MTQTARFIRVQTVFLCALLTLFLLVTHACSSDSDDPVVDGDSESTDGDANSDFSALSNELQLHLSEAGDIELHLGERSLLALSGKSGLLTRRYDETVESSFGQYKFTRSNEEKIELLRSDEAPIQGKDSYLMHYAASDDSISAELQISVVDDDTSRMTFTLSGQEVDSFSIPLRCDEEATFHGFGEQYNGTDQRGEAFRLMVSEQGIGREPSMEGGLWMVNGNQHTTYFPMPYFINATGGYGVLLETDYRSYVDLCQSDEDIAWFEVTSNEPLSLLLFHGPQTLDVIEQLGRQIGRPAAPPQWAYEAWMCTQGGPAEVERKVAELEAAQVPFGAIWVQDWTGKRENIGGGSGVEYRWEHDSSYYPDLAGLVASMHEKEIKVLAYVNPFVQQELPNHFEEMDEQGLLVKNPESGESYIFTSPAGQAGNPDFTNPAAVQYVQNALSNIVTELGIDGWMSDFGEYLPLDVQLSDGSDPRAYHNRYPIEWTRMTREVMDELRPNGDWVMFSRSGWTGSQAVAQIHWVGDQEATWSEYDGLPTVVPAMLNLGLCGQPYVTHDIAGFSGGPSSKELFMRWTELGAFTPIMRTHDGNNKDENWYWNRDQETAAHFKRFAKIHQVLIPDFVALSEQAQQSGAPILRHLMLVFPNDSNCLDISDQFMIGDALLVAPVTAEGATTRSVYFPPGDWYNVWTGEKVEGGQRMDVQAPIGSPPVYAFGSDRADLRAITE